MNLNNVQAGTGIQILRTPALRFSGHAIKTDQKYGTARARIPKLLAFPMVKNRSVAKVCENIVKNQVTKLKK